MLPHIAIIGAGVSGLSTGIELLQLGYTVTIYAREITPNTTSDIAPAIWMPYKVENQPRIMQWAVLSLKKFKQIETETPHTGIQYKTHTQLYTINTIKPEWMEHLDSLPTPNYIPDIYKAYSYSVTIPVIDTTQYMPYLMNFFLILGGTVKNEEISPININQLLKQYHCLINCSGLGAKTLFNDQTLYPIRGQVLSVKKIPGFDDSITRLDDKLTHIISRTHDCLLGGTIEDNNWTLIPDKISKEAILTRAREICTLAEEFEILTEKVGLRPARPTIRLEAEYINGSIIIHNYGHGGAGISLSWGCAHEVAHILQSYQ